MYKYLFLGILIIFTGCAQKGVIATKKNYYNVSKDAVLEASKKVFILANKREFLINSYRNSVHIERVMFEYDPIDPDIYMYNWVLETKEAENKTEAILKIYKNDKFDDDKKDYFVKEAHDIVWDRIDYLLGLKKDWTKCVTMIPKPYSLAICEPFDYKSKLPKKEDFTQKILISQRNALKEKIKEEKSALKTQENLELEYGSLLNFEEEKVKKEDPESLEIKNLFDMELEEEPNKNIDSEISLDEELEFIDKTNE